MYTYSLTLLAAVQGDDGGGLGKILSELPTDPASVLTILLLVGAFGVAVWAGTRSNGGDKPGQ